MVHAGGPTMASRSFTASSLLNSYRKPNRNKESSNHQRFSGALLNFRGVIDTSLRSLWQTHSQIIKHLENERICQLKKILKYPHFKRKGKRLPNPHILQGICQFSAEVIIHNLHSLRPPDHLGIVQPNPSPIWKSSWTIWSTWWFSNHENLQDMYCIIVAYWIVLVYSIKSYLGTSLPPQKSGTLISPCFHNLDNLQRRTFQRLPSTFTIHGRPPQKKRAYFSSWFFRPAVGRFLVDSFGPVWKGVSPSE